MNIAEYVSDFLERRNLTDAQLAEMLGYKSKTSIVRVRSQNVGWHSLEVFADRLRSRMNLSTQENIDLDEAMKSLYWQEDFEAIQSMHRLLIGDVDIETDPIVELLSAKGSAMPFLNRYASASEIQITLCNCHHVSIYVSLHNLMRNAGARVDHYLVMQENTAGMIDVFHKIQHVFYDHAYTSYCVNFHTPNMHRGMYTSDFMVISYRNDEGTALEDLIIFDQPKHGFIIPGTPQDNFRTLFPIPEENCLHTKRTFPDNSSLEEYVRYCMNFANIEYNRAVFRIKPNIPILWIPTEILVSAINYEELPAAKNSQTVFNRLVNVSKRRTKNAFEKKQPTHSILKQNAMWNFTKTGKSLDHFWALRPFTPEERLQILTGILHQVRTNPYFHIHFLKDNHFLQDEEFILYDGEGVLMTDCHTDYNLADGHTEMMIMMPEFCRLFRDYFTRILLPQHVLPESETCNLLQRMIQYCETLIDSNAQTNAL